MGNQFDICKIATERSCIDEVRVLLYRRPGVG